MRLRSAIPLFVAIVACSDTSRVSAPMRSNQLTRVAVPMLSPPTGMTPEASQARRAQLREAIIAEYPKALRDTVRALLSDSASGGFFAAPTSTAANLLGEYYALTRVESQGQINALVRAGSPSLPVVVALVDTLPGDGARLVRRAFMSPHDIILVSAKTNSATLTSAVSALLLSRQAHGALPEGDLTTTVHSTDAPDASFPKARTALAKLQTIQPQVLNGIGTYPWIRIPVGGKRAGQGSGPGHGPRIVPNP